MIRELIYENTDVVSKSVKVEGDKATVVVDFIQPDFLGMKNISDDLGISVFRKEYDEPDDVFVYQFIRIPEGGIVGTIREFFLSVGSGLELDGLGLDLFDVTATWNQPERLFEEMKKQIEGLSIKSLEGEVRLSREDGIWKIKDNLFDCLGQICFNPF